MWNQVASECLRVSYFFPYRSNGTHTSAILLIRTYAFFNRNNFVLCFLLSALAGVVAYQLYVDTTQMLCEPISFKLYESLTYKPLHSVAFLQATLCMRDALYTATVLTKSTDSGTMPPYV